MLVKLALVPSEVRQHVAEHPVDGGRIDSSDHTPRVRGLSAVRAHLTRTPFNQEASNRSRNGFQLVAS